MSAAPGPIPPHGGTLVERFDPGVERGDRPAVTLSARQAADLDLIAVGALSPLDGFMDSATYRTVVEEMRLPNGLAWSLPVTLGLSPDDLAAVGSADEIALQDDSGRFLGTMEVRERFSIEPSVEPRPTASTY